MSAMSPPSPYASVVEKRFEDRKPQTRVRMSPAGRRAFAEHVAYLREIIDSARA